MDNIDKIWQEYNKNKNQKSKEKLIIKYAPIVKYVAERLDIHVNSFVGYDDLIGYGILGLIDAIEKFNYSKGIKFESYASIRIRGTIIDNIRQLDWVPRTLRQQNSQLKGIYSELENELNRPPYDIEVANKLGISEKDVAKLIRKSTVIDLISLEAFFEDEEKNNTNNILQIDGPEKIFEKEEIKNLLAEAIQKLNEQEKTVIILYYFEYLTCKEIGHIMNISEARVSQIHSKAILHLQNKLGKYKPLLFCT